MTPVPRFDGGRTAMIACALVALASSAATALGVVLNPREALTSWLFAFVCVLSAVMGALLWTATFHASHSRWAVAIRRQLEWLFGALPLLAALFLPLVFGLKHVYLWANPPGDAGAHLLELLRHKAPYLNGGFFSVRAAAFFALWLLVAALLSRMSRAQDDSGAVSLTAKQRRLSAGSLPLLVLSFTFATTDWVLSLQPEIVNTGFGLYVVAGGAAAALSVVSLLLWAARPPFALLLSAEHRQRVGNLLLSFVCLWAYLGFSQTMLIWIANLPAEAGFYKARSEGSWSRFALLVIVLHFALPALLLLSRRIKRSERGLVLAASLVLTGHVLDCFWMVVPALHPDGVYVHWTQLSSLVAVVSATASFVLLRARGTHGLPVRDPFLLHALHPSRP